MESRKNALRTFASAYFRAVRNARDLTQAEMAEELGIDVRSYSDLEHAKNLCSTPVLISYLNKFKKQVVDEKGETKEVIDMEFIEEAIRMLDTADQQG